MYAKSNFFESICCRNLMKTNYTNNRLAVHEKPTFLRFLIRITRIENKSSLPLFLLHRAKCCLCFNHLTESCDWLFVQSNIVQTVNLLDFFHLNHIILNTFQWFSCIIFIFLRKLQHLSYLNFDLVSPFTNAASNFFSPRRVYLQTQQLSTYFIWYQLND